MDRSKTLGRSPSRTLMGTGKTLAQSPSKLKLKYKEAPYVTSVGDQASSQKKSASRAVFSGAEARPSHARDNVPGPGSYKRQEGCGVMVDSTKRSAPVFSMSGRETFGSTANLKDAAAAPGPGAYTLRLVNPNEKKSPAHSIPGRWVDSHDMHRTPGPGQYKYAAPPSTSKQVLSTKPSAAAVQIGTSRRKPLLDEGADIVVGPGEYQDINPKSYKYKKEAAFSFSVAGRKRPAVGDATAFNANKIGPNTSVRSSLGMQRDSTRRTAPSCTMSGRTKFGSPTLW